MSELKVYKVGGAVRDRLLGLPVKDIDWVVVGATPEEMIELGYRSVGKDFPVFLHPDSHEEYALARTERKTAPGYTGFAFHAAPDVTLEQDLQRRDLTINAMAEDSDGRIIDPYGGQQDLQARLLRHVSPAFAEDPVRILRVGRFLARFAPLGFSIAEETLALMRQLVDSGEVDALVPERVWQETVRALAEPSPQCFIQALRDCGALAVIFPELERLFGVPQPEEHHPEIDTGVHTLMVLEQAARLSPDPLVRFAALLHDLGKGITPKQEWPRHLDHEEKGVPLVEGLCARLRTPREYRDLAVITARYHLHFHRAGELKASTLVDLLQQLDAYRKPQRFEQWLLACEADARGRPGYEARPMEQAGILRQAYAICSGVEARPYALQGLQGPDIAEAVRKERIRRIKAQAG